MKWRVLLEVTDADGRVVTHEVSSGSRPASGISAGTVGLTLAEGKSPLAGLQQRLVRFQAGLFCRERRLCQGCGSQRPIKDRRSRRVTTLFGTITSMHPASIPADVASRHDGQSVPWPR